jgi:hypothetical protein
MAHRTSFKIAPTMHLSVHMKQFENCWTDFHEILYWEVLVKDVDFLGGGGIRLYNGHFKRKHKFISWCIVRIICKIFIKKKKKKIKQKLCKDK